MILFSLFINFSKINCGSQNTCIIATCHKLLATDRNVEAGKFSLSFVPQKKHY
jgi:hypothetical protein